MNCSVNNHIGNTPHGSSPIVSNETTDNCFACLNQVVHTLNGGKNIVVGDGLMAKAFLELNLDKNVLVFASGVSNSNEENQSAFDQEKKLFLDINKKYPDHTIVYFSSCSIFDPGLQEKSYVHHKKNMESLIAEQAKSYCIFRLPIMVGRSDNPNTLVNNLYNNIINGKQFNIWKNAKRYLIDVDDVYAIVHQLLVEEASMNTTINVAFSQYTIVDIVKTLEKITGKKSHYTLIDQGGSYAIDTSAIDYLLPEMRPKSDVEYLESMLGKYYSDSGCKS